ncbi:MAG: aminoglycoside 3'-phosphotransferase [Chloroflexi bacterium]|nr:aminoglycoside 3'-phosphotransferase [Chloroflexota bacterium]
MESPSGSLKSLPRPLRPLVEGRRWTLITIGESAADIFRLDGTRQSPLYLKVSPLRPRRDLLREKERLEWLHGRLPVPEVFAYETDGREEYMVLSALPGRDAASLCGVRSDDELVMLLAQGLRLIHSVPIEQCPFDMSLDQTINQAKRNGRRGLVEDTNFDCEHRRYSAAEVLEELLSTRPADEDLVFTHGDYCLPNVLIDGEEVTGFVDWGSAGIADRYKDIALVVESLQRNTGRDLQATFCKEYGLTRPSAEKIKYYSLLDEL